MSAPQQSGQPTTVTEVDLRIRDNIRALLRVNRVTQTVLAEAIGLDEGTMSRVMNGHRRLWANQLERAAEVLGVPVEAFYARSTAELAAACGLTVEQMLERAKIRCFTQPQLWPVAVKDAS